MLPIDRLKCVQFSRVWPILDPSMTVQSASVKQDCCIFVSSNNQLQSLINGGVLLSEHNGTARRTGGSVSMAY